MIYKKVARHGNTLAIVIPKQWLKELNIHEGDYVVMAVHENEMIIIKKAQNQFIKNIGRVILGK